MNVRDLMKPEKEIQALTERFMTEDVLFGYVTNLKLEDYLDVDKVAAARKQISEAKRRHCNHRYGCFCCCSAGCDGGFMRIWHVGKSNNVSVGMR